MAWTERSWKRRERQRLTAHLLQNLTRRILSERTHRTNAAAVALGVLDAVERGEAQGPTSLLCFTTDGESGSVLLRKDEKPGLRVRGLRGAFGAELSFLAQRVFRMLVLPFHRSVLFRA